MNVPQVNKLEVNARVHDTCTYLEVNASVCEGLARTVYIYTTYN